MQKIIQTDTAPQAIGAYSQAVLVNNHCYLSGQVGINPKTGELVSSDFTEQTEQVFCNLKAVLEAAEMTVSDVIKINIFLTDISAQYAMLNKIMQQHFDRPYPARAAVEVSALPKGALVEIEAIAVRV